MSVEKIVLSEVDIQKGINEGKFDDSSTLIRNNKNGQIVKVIKRKNSQENYIPSTIIQVNYQYIYYANLKSVIDIIINNQDNVIYDELKEKYDLVIALFKSYITYKDDIRRVYDVCLEVAVKFDNRIKNEVEKIDLEKIEYKVLSNFIGSLDSYVNVLLAYIISAHILYKDKFSNDSLILNHLLDFEASITKIYEQLLAKSTSYTDRNGKAVLAMTMEDSIYSMYIFDENYDLDDISRLVYYDSRFPSALDVLKFFKSRYLNGSFNNGDYRYDYERKIAISTKRINPNSSKKKLLEKLYIILEAIDNLKNIRNEIVEMKGAVEMSKLLE